MSDTEKKYNVIVNDCVKFMMLEHITFLSQVSTNAANRLFDSFEKAFSSLSQFPHRCPVFEAPYSAFQYRRMIVDRHALLYIVDEKQNIVFVEYILDTRQTIVMP